MDDTDILTASAVGIDPIVFGFERDFAGELKCIPMISRLKLDRCGVKLSLKQWNKFAFADRQRLGALPCDTIDEIDSYGNEVVVLLAGIGETASRFQIDLTPAWETASGVPRQVTDCAVAAGLRPPADREWTRLTPLQRFVLIKLTRPGHTNANLGPAMREFGLPA